MLNQKQNKKQEFVNYFLNTIRIYEVYQKMFDVNGIYVKDLAQNSTCGLNAEVIILRLFPLGIFVLFCCFI